MNSTKGGGGALLVIGGRGATGSTITAYLRSRGSTVITVSKRQVMHDDTHISADITNASSVNEICERGPFSGIVFAQRTRSASDWKSEVSLMLSGPVNLLTILIAKKQIFDASVVFLNSNAAYSAQPRVSSAYHAVRSGIFGLIHSLVIHNQQSNIRFNSISFGTILKQNRNGTYDEICDTPSRFQRISKCTPMRRLVTSSDIAKAVEFLLSDNSSMINGQDLRIDGGLSVLGQEYFLECQ